MRRLAIALVAGVIGVPVACGGDEPERVAVGERRYQSLLYDHYPQPALDDLFEAMRGGRPRDDVDRRVDAFEQAIAERIETLDAIEPPEHAQFGHDLLLEALERNGDEVAELIDEYRPELTPDDVETLIARFERLESTRELEDARAELTEAGFSLGTFR